MSMEPVPEQPKKTGPGTNKKKKHIYNHAKLRILMAIYLLNQKNRMATANSIHEVLPDFARGDIIRQRLYEYYIRGRYVKRTIVPRMKVPDKKKTMHGWSTRESFKYKLTEKGENIMWQLALRYKKGLELNLHNRNPKHVNYYKYWTEEDIRKAGITDEDLARLVDDTNVGKMPREPSLEPYPYQEAPDPESDCV